MKVKHLLFLFGVCFCLLSAIAYSSWNLYLYQIYRHIPGQDKTGHFFVVGILTLLVNLHWRLAYYQLGRFSILKGTVVVALFMVGDEVLQSFSPMRRFDWGDVCSNFAGALCFGFLSPFVFSYFSSGTNNSAGSFSSDG